MSSNVIERLYDAVGLAQFSHLTDSATGIDGQRAAAARAPPPIGRHYIAVAAAKRSPIVLLLLLLYLHCILKLQHVFIRVTTIVIITLHLPQFDHIILLLR